MLWSGEMEIISYSTVSVSENRNSANSMFGAICKTNAYVYEMKHPKATIFNEKHYTIRKPMSSYIIFNFSLF